MATFNLNTSLICSFNRKSVHSPDNAKHYRPMPKKRMYPTLPCLMISPAQTPVSYVSCGKGSFDQRGYGTPQGVAKDDGIAIRSFLKGKRIIVTGATGFIAKGIVEKILRTAPDVGKLYILIKAEDNEDAGSRLEKEIINDEVFRLLKEEHGKFYNSFMLSKLEAVAGNLREDGLGVNPESAYEMQNIVDVILHSAGNTTFDERFDVSLDINTRGSSRIMKFAKGCKNIKLFLHLSTAFACGQQQGKIMEEPYFKSDQAPLFDIEEEMRLAFDHTNFQESDNKAISNKMKSMGLNRAKINGWQDTYSFTKAMTEVLLDQMRDDIPLVTIRPSVVESSFKSPFPGWIQGNRTIDPVIILFGKGRLTSLPGNPDTIFDVVPVDMVVNATLAAMAKHGTGEGKPKLEVYHVTSSNRNPIRLSELLEYVYQHFNLNPLMDRHGHPIHVKSSVVLNSMEEYSTQAMSLASHVHNSRIQKKAMEQLHHLGKIYEPYTFFKAWFDDTNTVNLLNALSKEEREVFDFDVKNINWMDYYMNIHVPGLKTYVMMGRGSTPIPFKVHATKP